MRLKRQNLTTNSFLLFDETNKKLTLDKETKKLLRRLKIEKKLLIKRNLGNILATNLLH